MQGQHSVANTILIPHVAAPDVYLLGLVSLIYDFSLHLYIYILAFVAPYLYRPCSYTLKTSILFQDLLMHCIVGIQTYTLCLIESYTHNMDAAHEHKNFYFLE